jgi:hypothetical protein
MFDILYVESAYQELKEVLPIAREQLTDGLQHYATMERDQECEEFAEALAKLSFRIQLNEKRFNQLKLKRRILYS